MTKPEGLLALVERLDKVAEPRISGPPSPLVSFYREDWHRVSAAIRELTTNALEHAEGGGCYICKNMLARLDGAEGRE